MIQAMAVASDSNGPEKMRKPSSSRCHSNSPSHSKIDFSECALPHTCCSISELPMPNGLPLEKMPAVVCPESLQHGDGRFIHMRELKDGHPGLGIPDLHPCRGSGRRPRVLKSGPRRAPREASAFARNDGSVGLFYLQHLCFLPRFFRRVCRKKTAT